jgi:Ricin-type beta-trefoil lectin domain-like
MSITIQYLQDSGNGNAFATVNGRPTAGVGVISMPYSGAPAQQWIAAQYPGTDKTNSGGVVFVLYYGGKATSQLVITAAGCQQPVVLQPFQQYNLNQLWSYTGAGSSMLNLATGCVLDVSGGNINGGTIQTWPIANNTNQQWTLVTDDDAARVAREAEATEALVAG